MKWLRFLLLLGVVFAVGCSSSPSGSSGEADEPAATADDVDEAVEAEAAAGEE